MLGSVRSYCWTTEHRALQAGISDPRYPPRRLPTHVPTRAVIRTASYRVVRRRYHSLAAKAPGRPPLPPSRSPSANVGGELAGKAPPH
jgi:hypothetical protein